jgi:hypothetical protein
VSPPIHDVIADWGRRASQIPGLLERNAPLITQPAFNDCVDAAVGLRAWIEGLFPDARFPFVDQTGPLIATTFWKRPRKAVNATAQFVERMTINHCQSGPENLDWNKSVRSTASNQSFSCSSYIVMISQITRIAAVLFINQDEGFSNFG